MWMFGAISGGGSPGVSQAFYDLGDTGGTSYATTNDGLSHDLDVSDVVPKGAKAILFRGYITKTNSNVTMQIYKKGAARTSAAFVAGHGTSSSGGITMSGSNDLISACNDTRIVTYIVSNGATTTLRLVGYWV